MTPIALTIAGSDCSAGAGLQADLKTFSSFGIHGLTVVTAVVSETPLIVRQVHPVPPVVLQDQLTLLLETYPINALKTGMLYSKAHIVAICEILADTGIPLVVDPVMVASTGDPLLEDDALAAMSERLLPLATVLTPNLPEAGLLLGRSIGNYEEQEEAARELSRKFSAACYLKGGHAAGQTSHRDCLAEDETITLFEGEHLEIPQTHGTGCTLSAALTAGLAAGKTLGEAAQGAHRFTHEALRQSREWPTGTAGEKIFHLQQTQALIHLGKSPRTS